jgi:hypothetical protein
MANRDHLVKRFVARNPKPAGSPFGPIGHLSPGQRIKRARATEDDPHRKVTGTKRKG